MDDIYDLLKPSACFVDVVRSNLSFASLLPVIDLSNFATLGIHVQGNHFLIFTQFAVPTSDILWKILWQIYREHFRFAAKCFSNKSLILLVWHFLLLALLVELERYLKVLFVFRGKGKEMEERHPFRFEKNSC